MRDYHIHYYLDGCVNDEMILPSIEKTALELGITEGAVLKHYSHSLPNGKEDWVFWHKIKPAEWERYLAEFAAYKPQRMKIYSGVETELSSEDGDINIPLEEQEKIDIVQLSAHYMIALNDPPVRLSAYLDTSIYPPDKNPGSAEEIEGWFKTIAEAGEEKIIAGLVNGYMNAIKRFPKVRSLAHMADGLKLLRSYRVDVKKVPQSRTLEIFEPLMRLMAEKGVVWELLDEFAEPYILKRAAELGVKFTASADAHFLTSGWGPLTKHADAEALLDKLALPRGRIEI